MKVWHPWQLKKLKSWGPFWSYQLNCIANSAHLAHYRSEWNGLDWQCFLAGSSKTSPRILIFFQLPWVPIIHLSLFPLSIECPNFLGIIKFSWAVCNRGMVPNFNLDFYLIGSVCYLSRPHKQRVSLYDAIRVYFQTLDL